MVLHRDVFYAQLPVSLSMSVQKYLISVFKVIKISSHVTLINANYQSLMVPLLWPLSLQIVIFMVKIVPCHPMA